MTPTNSSTANAKSPAGIGVRYDETAALYTSQVVVNSIEDTVLLECSSGFVRSETGKTILPIEKRLAMTTDTARRLGNLLIEVADEMDPVDDKPQPRAMPQPHTMPQLPETPHQNQQPEADTQPACFGPVSDSQSSDVQPGTGNELGKVWLSNAARLQCNMRRVLSTFPQLD